jgi:hypothetical protein
MRDGLVLFQAIVLALGSAACAGSTNDGGGGEARVTIGDAAFDVNDVQFSYEMGEGGYFRVEGNDAANPNGDCVPGLSGGIALYGDLPADVTTLEDLVGAELPFEFSGDGDDFNLCFVGSNGLLGVERGSIRFNSVEGATIGFSFSGSFVLYDGEGGESPSPVNAMGSGIARVDSD